MIDGAYNVKVDVLPGAPAGKIVLRTEGDEVEVDINAPVVGKQRTTGTVDGNTFEAKGSFFVLLVGSIDYVLRGEVDGDDIHVVIESNKGTFNFRGERA